jgi:hypothetical protein
MGPCPASRWKILFSGVVIVRGGRFFAKLDEVIDYGTQVFQLGGLRRVFPDTPLPHLPLQVVAVQTGEDDDGNIAGAGSSFQVLPNVLPSALGHVQIGDDQAGPPGRRQSNLSPEPASTVRLAFLAQRSLSETFAERLAALSVERPGEHYTLLGPWSPYSFV